MVVTVAPSGDTTGATDRAAIQAAIDAATGAWSQATQYFATAEPVEVTLLGKYYINAALTLKDGVHLKGYGWFATSIHLAAGSNSRMLTSSALIWATLSAIQFDGHVELQTGGDYVVAIDTGFVVPVAGMAWPYVKDVLVQNADGTGFYFASVEAHISGCFAYRSGNNGFECSATDMFFEFCTAGETKNIGFLVTGSAHHFSDCKSWWSGYYTANRAAGGSKTGMPADVLNFTTWDVRGNENQFANCDGQDSRGSTWLVRGNQNVMNVQADAADGPCLQFIGGKYNTVRLNIGGGSSHGMQATHAVGFWGNGEVGNIIEANWTEPDTANVALALAANVVTSRANSIKIGTPDAIRVVTYAATVTPSVVNGGPSVTLTGPITVANPAADRFMNGIEMVIELIQDATGGRAVTWGSAYTSMTAIDTAPNKTNQWTVRCTGMTGRWVQTHFVSF